MFLVLFIRPERFLGEKINPHHFFPFGVGPRDCVGKNFANRVLDMTVLKLSAFKFTCENVSLEPKFSTVVFPNKFSVKVEHVN